MYSRRNSVLALEPALPDGPHLPPGQAPTPLVGRETDIRELGVRLTDPHIRLVTVTGPVGVGKSRLAAAVFDDVLSEFPDGGRFLSSPTDPQADPDALAQGVVHGVRDRRFLLALDHCEQIMDTLRQVLPGLLAACPRLTVLVAADEPLGVYGENLYRLGPLAVPESADDPARLREVPAVRLFLERARAARPDFALTGDNAAAVAALCARTDGLPLAIELAAARMKLTSPQRLLAELEEDLGALSGGPGDCASRHHCMRAAIESRLARLAEEDAAFLHRLACFHGPFGLDSAVDLGGAPPARARRILERLVDRNLLQAQECPDGEIGFQMLGLIRRRLLEAIPPRERDRLMREHAEHFAGVVKAAQDGLSGAEQARWLDMLAQVHPDLMAALRLLTSTGENAEAVALTLALRRHWLINGRLRDGVHWLSEGLATGALPRHLGTGAQRLLGELLLWSGEHHDAHRRLTQARAAYREMRDDSGAAACERLLGLLACHRGELAEAGRLLEGAVRALRDAGTARGHALALRDLAECRRAQGRPEQARELAERALHVFLRQDDTRNVALTRCLLAHIADDRGEGEEAERLYRQSLTRLCELGDLPACAAGLERYVLLLTARHGRMTESWRRAVRALAAADRLRAVVGCPSPQPAALDGTLAQARSRLGEEAFEEAWRAGRSAEPGDVVAETLAPLRGRRPARVRPADTPLTERELEVAELVARGLTNREIARRLGIAEWTVVNHLRKIMRKLDCCSRVQVASWMTRLLGEADPAA
ncbi:LuxR C-terminal-related transcriptional regulator [Thermomonospora amylolytica]|uniref:LuxR C-terminal-related transcriptional regulator n=1 Tax=Thermomonospora amylolytica TaxID=1411117 RepID=UPI000E6BC29C|nr:LuxR C-terminal-related transcriptional regulator [Thermomonospora amylolytica]